MDLMREPKLPKIIQIRNVRKQIEKNHNHHTILPECSIEIEEGEMVAITGESGIGKSTLLNIIGCLDTPTSGTYWLEGQEINTLSLKKKAMIRKETFGYVFQQYWLIKHLTVIENVELSIKYKSKSKNYREIARETLCQLGLENHLYHLPEELSGGQQQRVSIARAIVTKPKVLIADEPTGALDESNSLQIMQTLDKINKERKTTIILVTHDKKVAQFCNTVYPIHSLFTHNETNHART